MKFEDIAHRMKDVGYNDYMVGRIREVLTELQRKEVKGLERFVRKLANNLNHREQYLDLVYQGRFALCLADNAFSNIRVEPFPEGVTGPDIKADCQGTPVYFEVTRRRPNEEDELWEAASAQGMGAWVDKADIRSIVSKIDDKLKQLVPSKINVVVLWSDTVTLDESEMEEAFGCLQDRAKSGQRDYIHLSAVLFTTGGITSLGPRQFFLYENVHTSNPLPSEVSSVLSNLMEPSARKRWKELVAWAEQWFK